ncbi:MAG: divalent metal cation transporter [Planctomycetes bacterium]|nr:divalent metal cation transporter [Planctomycetota bacterium]
MTDRRDDDIARIRAARAKGPLATFAACVRLSGPGWLQSAITLGGGSLASSLYLGVLAGMSMLWLQPFAMLLGIVMLSAIAYVVLSTGERPFGAINRHVSPVLGWSWAIATLLANIVWSLPQFSLASGVLQQNLFPGLLGSTGALGDTGGKLAIVGVLLVLAVAVTWSYDRGARGVLIYERTLKVLVGLIVVCFAGVVVRLALASDVDLGAIAGGFVPDVRQLSEPAATFAPWLGQLGDGARRFWSDLIVQEQRDVMISAAATAVGINMTFLLPYSLLKRGWNREFRGLAHVDLAIGMLIPFLLATSCVVIAAASRFHTEPVPGLVAEARSAAGSATPAARLVGEFDRLCDRRLADELGAERFAAIDATTRSELRDALPRADREIAAMLVHRDAFDLARALEPFTGSLFANVLFGIGVLGMALSTITLLMLISGFVICEMLGLPARGWPHRLGCLAGGLGALGPFVWSGARFYLAVPTSVFGMALLPIAYWTFFLMMNSRRLLGDDLPRGSARVAWNSLMLAAAGAATLASVYSIRSLAGWPGVGGLGALVALALVVRPRR